MYFHVYLIYRFTRTFTDHSSVITRCWGFELQNGKSSLKSPQTLVTPDFARASFLSTHSIPQISERIAPRCARFGIPALFVNQIFTKEVRHAEGHARHSRPRRLGKNDLVRGAFIRLRRTAEARPRRPRRRLPRHRRARARARHHDLFQAGNAVCGRQGVHAA